MKQQKMELRGSGVNRIDRVGERERRKVELESASSSS